MRPGEWREAGPPFLLGFSLAVTGMVSVGLLLYGGPGLVRALMVIVASLLASLSVGVGTSTPPEEGDSVEWIRRRWLVLLFALALAAAFAAGWEIFQGFGARALSQGLGLAFLVALPGYFGGRVLSALEADGRKNGGTSPLAPALAGSAAGVLTLGFLFFPTLSPTPILLIALLATSGGALLHGALLDHRLEVTRLRAEPGPGGPWEIQRRVRAATRTRQVAVRERGTVRVLRELEGSPVRPEERAAETLLKGVGEELHVEGDEGDVGIEAPPRRVLALGWGAGVLVRSALQDQEGGGWTLQVVDRTPERFQLLCREVEWSLPADGRVETLSTDVLHFLLQEEPSVAPASLDLVVVEAGTLHPAPDAAILPPGSGLRLRQLLRPGGHLLVLPLREGGEEGGLVKRWRPVAESFPRAMVYLGPRDPDAPTPERGAIFWACAGPRGWEPESVEGFLQVDLKEGREP